MFGKGWISVECLVQVVVMKNIWYRVVTCGSVMGRKWGGGGRFCGMFAV